MTITQSEMKELNKECCQTNCNSPATHYVFWPGQGRKMMCEVHKDKALGISKVMGFDLHIVEMPIAD